MLTLILLTVLASLIAMAISLGALTLGEKSIKEREKMTPFECGFSPFKKARSPFSLRFFMITLIFLIFDIEIALLLPLVLASKISSSSFMIWLGLSISVILLVGLLHEWNQGALNWSV